LLFHQPVLDTLESEDLIGALALESKISLNNMHAFNSEGVITKYSRPEEVLVRILRSKGLSARLNYFMDGC
jgi:hypothetical protein